MKKFLLSLAFLPFMASAQTLIDGIYYNLISKMKQAEVTNVSGNYYSGDVEIPSTVTYEDVEYTVTSIKASAFLWCENLKSVTIPNTVKTIGESAFYKCTSLNSVKLGTGVTSIGEDAFNGDLKIRTVSIYDFEAWCKIEFKSKASNPMLYGDFLYLNDMQVKAPKIPDSVTSIGDFAFIGCSHFVSVTIPNTVTSIGRYAFESCDSLTSISIPGSVETIGDFAFNECKKVTSLTISDGVKSIGKYAFGSCEGVTSLSIPNSVKSIGDDAFAGCNGITSVTFGNGLSSIGDYAFLECVGMPSAIIPEGVTRIGEGAFKGCSAISKLSLPSSLKELDPLAFAECPNLTNVYCYAEELPYTKRNALNWETPYITDLFKDSYIEYATLYVPETAIDAYKEIETWNGFGTIKTLSGEIPVTPKCATPTIINLNGKLMFYCETEDVKYDYSIVLSVEGSDQNITLPKSCKISVIATKEGYEPSDPFMIEVDMSYLIGKLGDVNKDGVVNGTDIQEVINIIVEGE